ncbi:hypothetical protein CCP3SC1AL1_4470002 [Gammaproteobacteria bacterium]
MTQITTTRLTYGQLLEHLKKLSEEDLHLEVSIHDARDCFRTHHLSVNYFTFASDAQDFYDIGYPYLCAYIK